MWAIRVLANAKSNRHRKTHQVELGGTGRQFWHLTRGDLRGERPEKSAEAIVARKPGNAGGAKGRRVTRNSHPVMGGSNAEGPDMRRSSNCGYYQSSAIARAGWILAGPMGVGFELGRPRKRERAGG